MDSLNKFLVVLILSACEFSPAVANEWNSPVNEVPRSLCKSHYSGQLTRTIDVSHYELDLTIDMKLLSFNGTASIHFTVAEAEPLRTIVLHAMDIEIASARLQNSKQKATEITLDPIKQTVRFLFNNSVESNDVLIVTWRAPISNTLNGFYKSVARKEDGTEDILAVTQFEPVHARRAFPCLDEPDKKATFDVSITTQSEFVALSNQREGLVEQREDGWTKTTYLTTPKMSTYLVAWAVGRFESVKTREKNTRVRVFSVAGMKNSTVQALEFAVEVLSFLESYFEIPYPMAKLDLLALPDFSDGAMENWGLMAFRESALVLNRTDHSKPQLDFMQDTVAHEIVHQWFGNLVTHQWWTDLWLTEGFASFMAAFVVDKLRPGQRTMEKFVAVELVRVLDSDSLESSHPIQVEVEDAADATAAFDEISYGKSASLLRWILYWLGENTFRKSLRRYLKANVYGNACPDDLFAAFHESSAIDVHQVFEGWITQTGYPLISVSELFRNGSFAILEVIQNPFLRNRLSKVPQKEWKLPINFITPTRNTDFGVAAILKNRTARIGVDLKSQSDWIKLNPQWVGLYRVEYSEEMFNRLREPIKDKTLSPLDRRSLASDLFALTMSGKKSTVDYFKSLELFMNDDDYYVWSELDSGMVTISALLTNTKYHEQFNFFRRHTFSALYDEKKTWDFSSSNDPDAIHFKMLTISTLGVSGHKGVLEKSRQLFENQFKNETKINQELAPIVYINAVIGGRHERVHERLIERFKNTLDEEERRRIRSALPAARTNEDIKRVLNLALSEHVRTQDALNLMARLAASLKGRQMLEDFMEKNISEFEKRWPNENKVADVVQTVMSKYATPDASKRLVNFWFDREATFPGMRSALKQGSEEIRINFDWLSREGTQIEHFLTEFQRNNPEKNVHNKSR